MKNEELKIFYKNLLENWIKDKVSTLSAAFAYYTLFSIPPLLVICTTGVALILGKSQAETQIMAGIKSAIGKASSQQLTEMMHSQASMSASIIASIIGIMVILISAIGFYSQLLDGLNEVCEVKLKPELGWRDLIIERIFAYVVVFFIILLFFLSILLSSVVFLFHNLIHPAYIFELIHLGASIIIAACFFFLIYKFIPDAKLPAKFVIKGAFFAAILFIIGKYLLSIYLAHASYTSKYGIAGSMLIVLLWLYYFGQVIFTGAEFIKVEMRKKGIKIIPAKKAISKQP